MDFRDDGARLALLHHKGLRAIRIILVPRHAKKWLLLGTLWDILKQPATKKQTFPSGKKLQLGEKDEGVISFRRKSNATITEAAAVEKIQSRTATSQIIGFIFFSRATLSFSLIVC